MPKAATLYQPTTSRWDGMTAEVRFSRTSNSPTPVSVAPCRMGVRLSMPGGVRVDLTPAAAMQLVDAVADALEA